jgi:tetratricopeptide (TPR) repeat protein
VRRIGALAVGLALLGCAAARPARDPLTADEHNDLGVSYFEQGETRRAASEFERAVALRPTWTRALVNLGDARLALGEVPGAIDAYQRAVALAPDDPGAANNLAWALLQDSTRWPEAEPIIDGALARHPEPRGYYLDTLGALRLRKGDIKGALDAFRAALADGGLERGASRALVLEHAAEAHARLGETGAAARSPRSSAGSGVEASRRRPGARRRLLVDRRACASIG